MKPTYKYFVVPERPAVQLHIPANEKQGTLTCIDAIQKLFGKGGKYWIKGDEKIEEGGINKFCLVGAAKEANGKYENAACAAIALAVAQMFPKRYDLNEDGVEDELADDEVITDFNDAKATKWPTVLKVLQTARRMVRES